MPSGNAITATVQVSVTLDGAHPLVITPGNTARIAFDFNIAATKYFDGLDDGEVPLEFLFSGSTFYRDEDDDVTADEVVQRLDERGLSLRTRD